MDYKYWHENAQKLDATNFQKLWREHSDKINTDLLLKWLPDKCFDRIFKTDLFDEYVSAGIFPFLRTKSKKIFGIDLSSSIAMGAQLKYPETFLLSADILNLPFKNNMFDFVFSNSTIDHFENSGQIETSLVELYRVLKTDGAMILTMDNINNPAVALRNKMPFLLYRIGILPYYVGVALRVNHLIQMLERIGFKVLDTCFIMHCPRIVCVAAASVMNKHASRKGQIRFLKILKAFERLNVLPTRSLTGCFIAVKAVKI